MPEPLTLNEVRHVAKLARLRLTDAELEEYRVQLSSTLDHIALLNELDVEDVEPMARPSDAVNRLDDDVVKPSMPVEQLLANAPAVEDKLIAVPKVLDDGGGA
jgi:aspartyl-tRNA(Asn)/glutamyl-tRNA(Gln) amidotransferase subunit C